jgi:hypothetical protein
MRNRHSPSPRSPAAASRRPWFAEAACLGAILARAATLSAAEPSAGVPASTVPQGDAGATNKVAATASAGPGTSAGWVNDRLRDQSDGWKAWDLGGQFRVRYEVKDNAGSFPNRDFIRIQDNDNDYLLERLRYHLGWTPAAWFTAYVEGRSSFEQWDKRSPTPELDAVNLRQAYVSFGDPKEFPLLAKVGRQELSYGEERMIGTGDWSNLGRTFDAAKLRYQSGNTWLDAFAGRMVIPVSGSFAMPNDYDWLFGLYGSTVALAPWQETQMYFLSRNVAVGAPSTPRDIYMVGSRWASLPGQLRGWDYSLEGAYQFGSINQANVRRDQASYALFASGGYTWKETWGSPRLGLGYEFGSGDSNPNDNRNQTFENLFGTNHRFYGAMDLFSARNLHIPRLCAALKPFKNLSVSAEYLLFWLADTRDLLYPETGPGRNQNGYGRHPGFDSFAGSEIDVVATYTVEKLADLQLGYGHFFVGDYIRQSIATVPANGGAVDANWCYVQARLNF